MLIKLVWVQIFLKGKSLNNLHLKTKTLRKSWNVWFVLEKSKTQFFAVIAQSCAVENVLENGLLSKDNSALIVGHLFK